MVLEVKAIELIVAKTFIIHQKNKGFTMRLRGQFSNRLIVFYFLYQIYFLNFGCVQTFKYNRYKLSVNGDININHLPEIRIFYRKEIKILYKIENNKKGEVKRIYQM